MDCLNCGNTDWFVLALECTVRTRGPEEWADPRWSLSLQCASCASTDVEGDPVALLAARST